MSSFKYKIGDRVIFNKNMRNENNTPLVISRSGVIIQISEKFYMVQYIPPNKRLGIRNLNIFEELGDVINLDKQYYREQRLEKLLCKHNKSSELGAIKGL